MKLSSLGLFIFYFFLLPKSFAFYLSLEDYLTRIKNEDWGMRACSEGEKSAEFLSSVERKGDLLFVPQLSGSFNVSEGQRESLLLHPTRLTESKIGISKNWPFGLFARFHFFYQKAGLDKMANDNQYQFGPELEMSFSPWGRNAFGAEYRQMVESRVHQAQALRWTQRSVCQGLQSKGQVDYWTLSYHQEQVKIYKKSLERALWLKNWLEKKWKRQLADQIDYLQALNDYQLKELLYKKSLDEKEEALRIFYLPLTIKNDPAGAFFEYEVGPLWPVEFEKMQQEFQTPLVSWSHALLAENEKHLSAIGESLVALEQNKATVELYTQWGQRGFDSQSELAFKEGVSNERPFWALGVRFVMPLDLGLLKERADAYRLRADSLKWEQQRKLNEHLHRVHNLKQIFKDLIFKMAMQEKIERAQNKKIMEERSRWEKGRTTFFQVLSFEQEHLKAQLDLLNIKWLAMTTYIQLKNEVAD